MRKRGNTVRDDDSNSESDEPSQDLFQRSIRPYEDGEDDEIPEEDLTDPRGAELFASGDDPEMDEGNDDEGFEAQDESLPPPPMIEEVESTANIPPLDTQTSIQYGFSLP